MNDSCVVFTVCNITYLPKALVLAESLKKFDNRKLKVFLFDKKQAFEYPRDMVEVIWIEDLNVPRLYEMAFTYDIIEFSTSLKPFISSLLLTDHESVIFLDPDTCLFSSLSSITEDLKGHDILLTPHYIRPQPSTGHESDLGMMRFGSFNLGFFAVNNTEGGLAFLSWWHARCVDHCFMESQFGLSTDQKWITIAPCLFENLHISFNPGYNAAPWNTFERTLSKNQNGNYIVNGEHPLVFFHFSNYDLEDKQYLNKRASSEEGVKYPTLLEISEQYAKSLGVFSASVDIVKYSFDFMSDGSYITPTLRRAYEAVREELPKGHDPFDILGPVGKFISKNSLSARTSSAYKYPSLAEASGHKKSFRLIYMFLRIILKIIGPERFYNLSKLLVYLSMFRKNRQLWKL